MTQAHVPPGGEMHVCSPEGVSSAPLLTGDIAYFRPPEVMHLVAMQRLTGMLRLIRDDGEVAIYFRDGDVCFAAGLVRGENEQLGSILLGMGRITEDGLNEALAVVEEKGVRLGRALVESGLVDEHSIVSALTKQTERSVYRTVAWSEGRFEFGLCDMPGFVDEFPLALRVESLMFEGMRRAKEMRLFTERIPSLDIVFSGPVAEPEEMLGTGLGENEMRVIRIVDGVREVRDVIAESGLDEFQTLKALSALYAAGLIKKIKKTTADERTGYL